jgi:glycosyltransferase involved in cell wall biosynthesis
VSKAIATPAISLVVCTLGPRQEQLRRLLSSLTNQTFRDFEVILVDQNPPGLLQAIVEQHCDTLELVHLQSSPGLSLARNVGLQHARGRLIAFPDDDCWYPPRLLAAVIEAMRMSDTTAALSGRTLDEHGVPSVSLFLDHAAQVSRTNFLACGNSNCLFVRADVFRVIGNFDLRLGVGAGTGFHSGEEADILLRVLDAGLRAEYRPDLIVHHDQVDSTVGEAQIRRAIQYGRGFGGLLRKHRFPLATIVYRVGRPLVGSILYRLVGKTTLGRYKWVWAKAIAGGYRTWPPDTPSPPQTTSAMPHAIRTPPR